MQPGHPLADPRSRWSRIQNREREKGGWKLRLDVALPVQPHRLMQVLPGYPPRSRSSRRYVPKKSEIKKQIVTNTALQRGRERCAYTPKPPNPRKRGLKSRATEAALRGVGCVSAVPAGRRPSTAKYGGGGRGVSHGRGRGCFPGSPTCSLRSPALAPAAIAPPPSPPSPPPPPPLSIPRMRTPPVAPAWGRPGPMRGGGARGRP